MNSYVIVCSRPTFYLTETPYKEIAAALEEGHRVFWDYLGLVEQIPKAAFLNTVDLYESQVEQYAKRGLGPECVPLLFQEFIFYNARPVSRTSEKLAQAQQLHLPPKPPPPPTKE